MTKLLSVLVLASACIPMMPQQGTTSSPSTASSETAGSSESSEPSRPGPAGTASAPASRVESSRPAASQTVSVTLRSSCSKTVKVFYGDKPRFSSGTESSISSNSVSSKTFQVGDKIWLLDDRGNGVDEVTVGSSTRQVEVGSSCSSLSG